MREKKGFGNLKLLNPRNLAREVHVYGYHFSWKMHTLTIVCSLLGISAIGVLFKLKPLFFWNYSINYGRVASGIYTEYV